MAAWQRAGEQALRCGAHDEAASHFRRGLAVLTTLPESPARDERDLHLQLRLGHLLGVTKGYGSREAAGSYTRARALGESLEEPLQVMPMLMGLWASASAHEGPAAAQSVADQVLQVAERAGLSPARVWAHWAQVVTRFHAGDLARAREHATQVLALYDEAAAVPGTFDPRIATLGYAALTAWHLGLADDARAHAGQGVELAEVARRPADRARVEQFSALLYTLLREPAAARAHAERALVACAGEPIPVHEAAATILRGWALAEEGAVADGLAALREGLDHYLATGQRLGLEFLLGCLADVHAQAGDTAEALATLDEAEGAVPGEELWRADTLRRRAELLARAGADTATVEATFRDALTVARRQGAKAYELRAGTSYALFLRAHGRAAEARELLAPLYASFTEGFDTRDLIEAKALLEELTCAPKIPTSPVIV